MDLTTDKLRSLVKKWRSLVEAFVDVKTTDGYVLRMFCIGFTKKQANSQRKTCYAQSAQKRALRAKMVSIMSKEASTCDLKELVIKLMPETLGKDIEKACNVRS
jgi:small subunit ribosomal protein S3Ae